MYRFSLTINDFLSSGSWTNVNLTSIKSFARIGCCETGQSIVGSGLSILVFFADGTFDGNQKLDNSLSFPFAIFETDGTDELVLGVSVNRFN